MSGPAPAARGPLARAAAAARPRVPPALAAGAAIASGLAVRGLLPPGFLPKHLGVALWAVLAYTLVLAARPRTRPGTAAGVALAVSWGVELFQLTPVPGRLSAVHPLLRLVFGETFSGADLVSLAAGVGAAWLVHGLGSFGRLRRTG